MKFDRIRYLEKIVQRELSDDLLSKKYRSRSRRHPHEGHCYVACEALYHLAGGRQSYLRPHFVRVDGEPHWFLRNVITDEIYDPTAGQFRTIIPYDEGIGKGFLTSQPSKRCKELLARI